MRPRPACRGLAAALPVLVVTGLGAAAFGQDDSELILPPSADVGSEPDADREPQADTGGGGREDGAEPVTAESAAAGDAEPSVAGAEDRRGVAARLAAPDRGLPMEEVIVVNESEWRLPDLGSEWRRAREEDDDLGRIELTMLPLYDPENRDPVADLFERNSELHRVGMIEVFRLRFGGRPQE